MNLMRKSESIVLVILVILSQSCLPTFSTRSLKEKSDLSLNSHNISGVYKNTNNKNNEHDYDSLWRLFQLNMRVVFDTTDLKSDLIRLDLKNQEKLEVHLIREGKSLKKLELKGKIKDNVFSLKRRWNLVPLYPLYLEDNESKAILSKTDNQLVFIQGSSQSGAFLVLAAGIRYINTYSFEEQTEYFDQY